MKTQPQKRHYFMAYRCKRCATAFDSRAMTPVCPECGSIHIEPCVIRRKATWKFGDL